MTTSHLSGPDYGTGQKKLGTYLIGIGLCVILTLIPFATVMSGRFIREYTFSIIITCAILQFLVQVIYFLRLNAKTAQGQMNLMSGVFTVLILAVVIGGSLWIMWHLNYNMMH